MTAHCLLFYLNDEEEVNTLWCWWLKKASLQKSCSNKMLGNLRYQTCTLYMDRTRSDKERWEISRFLSLTSLLLFVLAFAPLSEHHHSPSEKLTWKVGTHGPSERSRAGTGSTASIFKELIEESCSYQPSFWLSDSQPSYRMTLYDIALSLPKRWAINFFKEPHENPCVGGPNNNKSNIIQTNINFFQL